MSFLCHFYFKFIFIFKFQNFWKEYFCIAGLKISNAVCLFTKFNTSIYIWKHLFLLETLWKRWTWSNNWFAVSFDVQFIQNPLDVIDDSRVNSGSIGATTTEAPAGDAHDCWLSWNKRMSLSAPFACTESSNLHTINVAHQRPAGIALTGINSTLQETSTHHSGFDSSCAVNKRSPARFIG